MTQREVYQSDPVPKIYQGEIGVLIATGPTLFDEHIAQIEPYHESGRLRVFGCNDAYKVCEFLDVFYACDPKWWHANEDVFEFECEQKWTQDENLARKGNKGIKLIKGSGGQGLCLAENKIHYGGNSGFQMLNLAYHFGIRTFILLGYTMQVPRGLQQHFFGSHPKGLNQSTTSYRSFVHAYKKIQPNIKSMIINCTPQSLLADTFRNEDLSDTLERLFQSTEHRNLVPKKRKPLLGISDEQHRTRKTNENRDKRTSTVVPGCKSNPPVIRRQNRDHRRDRAIAEKRSAGGYKYFTF
jgi:hypothetical protein